MAEYSTTNPLIAPDGLSITPIWTTIITQSDGITEQRKAKQLFPKYDVKLKYPTAIIPTDIKIIYAFYMARKGAYEAFYIYDKESDAHVTQFVGWGDGSTLVFDIPGKTTSLQSVYIDGTLQSSGYTVLASGGTEDSDRIQFTVAPILGQLITCSFTGYLRMRVRFKEDRLSRENLTHLLYRGGEIELKGLSAEDL